MAIIEFLVSVLVTVFVTAGILAIIGGGVFLVAQYLRRRRMRGSGQFPLHDLIATHFSPRPISDLSISERKFPYRVRADLHRALDRLFEDGTKILRFCGAKRKHEYMGLSLSDCLMPGEFDPVCSTPPFYEEIDIGEESPVRCLQAGVWFLELEGLRFVVMLSPAESHRGTIGIRFEIAAPGDTKGKSLTEAFFKRLQEAVVKAESYRGKVLSLEQTEHSYSGASTGITVHRLRSVQREQVILPASTLELLERNVIQFSEKRERLRKLGQGTKKGLLFYGPPGTGKTHTIHYLARSLKGHTTLIIAAEHVGLLGEYMTLARLLQPTLVVIEDADLIARERTRMGSACEEVMLNKLLNEMDGLKESADILFVLTTNRPETLEAALASRPGRIDQAIEFPLPDEEGRAKLVRLYSPGIKLSDELIELIVRKTDKVSAAFIKELMRRIVQYSLDRQADGDIELSDVEHALEEMLFRGGLLNL